MAEAGALAARESEAFERLRREVDLLAAPLGDAVRELAHERPTVRDEVEGAPYCVRRSLLPALPSPVGDHRVNLSFGSSRRCVG